ncbi:glycerate kinase [Pseudactinotalea sp. HY158]|uniref:glycerate kinase n=1 Tax=Pseudactinotalea sp. HY158 TaxID=2654547 RepID=UPI00129CEBE3|nr:glycerate kinase [Pseudactinotalea sp. HY158]QGH68945.1 glycerate kinase [Pseudactinotalea sp. HY158]
MTTVVIAPDKFKGSLTAAQVADHLARGIEAALAADGGAAVEIRSVPMADGGEGTVDAALAAGFTPVTLEVTGPLGTRVRADYALDEGSGTAVVEMALASGLAMTGATDAHARAATSRGTGELVAHALDAGARRIVLGVGGSASTDGGAGMIAALGARLLGATGEEIEDGGAALASLASVDLAGLHPRIGEVEFVLAADVDNPLLGPAGAAAVYGPQKGAGPATVAELDEALARWARVLAGAGLEGAERGIDLPGAGAAGGVGYAALAVLGAHRESGIDVVLELTGFAAKVAGAALVITGEGSLDEQSLSGKTPVGVARAATAAGAITVAVAGRSTLTEEQLRAAGIAGRYALLDIEPDPEVCMREAGRLLELLGRRVAADHLEEES